MTDWQSQAVKELLILARASDTPPTEPTAKELKNLIVEDGLVFDSHTGILVRRELVLDEGPYGYCAPLYTYDRTNRFSCLLSPSGVPLESRGLVIRVFEQLETQWEATKEKYQRKYFLSQKLVLRQITSRLGIPCTLPVAIRDRKRRRKQLSIFDDMWRFLLTIKLA